MAATPSARAPGRLLSFQDSVTGTRFLIDTGASYSVVPYTSSDPQQGPKIVTADKRPIPCWGREPRQVSAGGRTYTVDFLLAAVAFPILGMDFLEKFQLDVSPQRRALLGPRGVRIPLQASDPATAAAHLGILAEKEEEECVIALAISQCTDEKYLRGYERLVAKKKGLPPVRHNVEHHIDTGDSRRNATAA